MNLRPLQPSRKALRSGDIFTMLLPSERFLFGRVVLVDRPRELAPMPRSNLIYIYRREVDTSDPPLELARDDLLIPPVWTNRLAWARGMFRTVAHRELGDRDLLPQHCFRRWTGDFFDESGRPLERAIEPCGDWALTSYLMLDDMISDALGIPRSP
jgi:Immunity protein 26